MDAVEGWVRTSILEGFDNPEVSVTLCKIVTGGMEIETFVQWT